MTAEQIERMIEEHNRQMADHNREIAEIRKLLLAAEESRREAQREIAESRRESAETDRRIREVTAAVGNLSNRWGDFMESVVAPGVRRVFAERGIVLRHLHRDTEATLGGEQMEIDILAVDEKYVVLVEVKSVLEQEDVDAHLKKLERFKLFFPEHKDKSILGAVAGGIVADQVSRYAYKKGLFVLGQSGETIAILNDGKFRAREW